MRDHHSLAQRTPAPPAQAKPAAAALEDSDDDSDDGNFEPMEVEGGRIPSRTRTSLPLLPVLPLFVPGANPSARRTGLMMCVAATCAVVVAIIGPFTILELFGGVLQGFGGIGPSSDVMPRSDEMIMNESFATEKNESFG